MLSLVPDGIGLESTLLCNCRELMSVYCVPVLLGMCTAFGMLIVAKYCLVIYPINFISSK